MNKFYTLLIVSTILLSSCGKKPKPKFSVNEHKSTLTVFQFEFFNESKNSLSFEWDFGDGTKSTELNPTHIYNKYGSFPVRLTTQGENGDLETFTDTVKVGYIVYETVDVDLSNLNIPSIDNYDPNDCGSNYMVQVFPWNDTLWNSSGTLTLNINSPNGYTYVEGQFSLLRPDSSFCTNSGGRFNSFFFNSTSEGRVKLEEIFRNVNQFEVNNIYLQDIENNNGNNWGYINCTVHFSFQTEL